MVTLIILSCSVAADATAVAIASSVRGITISRGLAMASLFGAAQALMAGIGWAGGAAVGDFWSAWDHWVTLVLLSIVGLKMIREALAQENDRKTGAAGFGSMLALSIATSLDALAVGVSLPLLNVSAPVALTMIGAVTLVFSAAGAALGRFIGDRFGRAVEIAGGVGLIGIGIKIVFDHVA